MASLKTYNSDTDCKAVNKYNYEGFRVTSGHWTTTLCSGVGMLCSPRSLYEEVRVFPESERMAWGHLLQ